MKKIYVFVLVLTIATLSGCSGYAYSGYNPINDPLGMTTRAEINAREATKRQDIVTSGDVEVKRLDSQARSDEASYEYKARSDEAYYDYQAKKAESNSEMIQGVAWATITPLTALIVILGLVLIVALIQAAKVLTGRPEFVPNLDDEYWRRR